MKMKNQKISFNHTLTNLKKFRDFTVWIIFKNNIEVVYEIKLPNNIFEENKYRIGIGCVSEPLIRRKPWVVYLDILDLHHYLCDEINIIFISNLKDMTFCSLYATT